MTRSKEVITMRSILLAIFAIVLTLSVAGASSPGAAGVISQTLYNSGYINTVTSLDSGHGYVATVASSDPFMAFASALGAVAGVMAVEADPAAISAVGVITGEHTQQVYMLNQAEAEYLYNMAQTSTPEQIGMYALTAYSNTITMSF